MRRYSISILLVGMLLIAGCGGSVNSSKSTSGGGPGPTKSNVMAISVNGGPIASQLNGGNYPNAAFASATICAPGSTTSCVTVNGLLVDTGSTGLRVLQSAVSSLNLPAVNASNSSAAYDCVSFVDGSYMWGPVLQADVTLGGETGQQVVDSASSAPVRMCPQAAPTAAPSMRTPCPRWAPMAFWASAASRPIASMRERAPAIRASACRTRHTRRTTLAPEPRVARRLLV